MVNVKSYSCFPTMIYEFEEVDKSNHMRMLNILDFQNENNSDELQNHLAFITFANKVTECTKEILHINQYEYEKVEITNMWGNLLSEGQSHAPHTHSNNILSGVYYLQSGSPIQFFDPRPAATILKPRNTPNWDNSGMIQFDSVEDIALFFPSWLMHWVPSTSKERASIAWNVIVRGEYGEPHTLQNAYI